MGLAVASMASCTDEPFDSAIGPGAETIDSTAWREQMSHRSGLFLSAAMVTCGEGATCTFDPVDYHCGGQKVECSLQIDPITVRTTSMVPKTVVVSGRGALLCNETMGTVTAYDALNDPVATVTLVPIDARDCGTDNITFGGTGTLTWEGGIDHIVIEPMSPLTFPTGGGTGIASATYTVLLNDVAIPFQVTCTATVVRADTVTCTATRTTTDSTAAITGWKFLSAAGDFEYARATNVPDTTWTGMVVSAGHVEVTATAADTTFPLAIRSNDIVITPRNWNAVPVNKRFGQKVPSLLTAVPWTIESLLGRGNTAMFQEGSPGPNPTIGFVGDEGPNNGLFYFTGPPFFVEDSVRINEAMADSTQWWFLQQTSDRFVNFGGGKRYFMCGRQRVVQMRPLVEAHEGVSWTTQPNSHAAQYFRAADSIIRVDGEKAVGLDIPIDTLIARTQRSAIAISNFIVDHTSANNLVMGPPPDSLVTVGGVHCKFAFFATPPTP
jgi:hypothetical protein